MQIGKLYSRFVSSAITRAQHPGDTRQHEAGMFRMSGAILRSEAHEPPASEAALPHQTPSAAGSREIPYDARARYAIPIVRISRGIVEIVDYR
jgi:hypothetical protein